VISTLAKITIISENIRVQIVNGLQSGGIGVGGINVPGTIPDTLKAQLITLFKDQFAHSLATAMKVGIIVILCGTVASVFISSHIRSAKEPTKPLAK
jgi:hypothetical protein